MLDIMFFVKTALLTAVIVAFLQIKVGGNTLETEAHQFIQTSSLIQPLHEVAESGVVLIRKGIRWSSEQINSRWHHNKSPMKKDSGFWQRSESYEREVAKKKEAAAEQDQTSSTEDK